MKLPQMIGYVRKFEGNTAMSFKISDRKIKFDSEPVYGDNDKYIKTKMKIYNGSVNENFQGKGVPKEFCCQSKEKVLSSNIFGGMQL